MEIKNKFKKCSFIRNSYEILVKILKDIRYILPKKLAHKMLYKNVMNKKLNLKEPKDFNEKIQYLMLYKYGELETKLADKYKVREYIENKGYKDILTKLYGVYHSPENINVKKLPNEFVIKTNHGYGNVFICYDKEKFKLEDCKKKLKKALKGNFAKSQLEYHYSPIKPLIICEEYINDGNGKNPLDYKIYCFNGKPECILMCSNREKELKLDYYDLEWNYLDYARDEYKSNKRIEKPKNLNRMIEIASELSKDMSFVRVDLYNVDGKIYFGELTFTPAAGMVKYNTQEALDYLGKLIKL